MLLLTFIIDSFRVDIHVRNLAFVLPFINDMSEEAFISMMGKPEIRPVQRVDGQSFSEPGVPDYIVQSASYQKPILMSLDTVKIIDFGQSFLPTCVPQTLRTPLPVRPPEVIFNSETLDYHVDLWGMGCMVRKPLLLQQQNGIYSCYSFLSFSSGSLYLTAP